MIKYVVWICWVGIFLALLREVYTEAGLAATSLLAYILISIELNRHTIRDTGAALAALTRGVGENTVKSDAVGRPQLDEILRSNKPWKGN